jgi:putative phosphoribosyl transferase
MPISTEQAFPEQMVQIPIGPFSLEGTLTLPEAAEGIVVFAHGSGSSRHSPRNRYVAESMHSEGLATLLMDLLSSEEEVVDLRSGHLRFDIDLLSERLITATDWLLSRPETSGLRVGYFGASTGAAAALVAAAKRSDRIRAVVSRGGRPDLAGGYLAKVKAPTLFIVGGRDTLVVDLNREAMDRMSGPKRLEVIPWATHLFEEPGALEDVSRLSQNWFLQYLTRR